MSKNVTSSSASVSQDRACGRCRGDGATIIPSSALGRDGAVAPSERIVVGGIGIGNRGTYDLGCFLEQKDVQFAAVCDIKETRRTGGQEKGRRTVWQSELRHVSRLPRTARP